MAKQRIEVQADRQGRVDWDAVIEEMVRAVATMEFMERGVLAIGVDRFEFAPGQYKIARVYGEYNTFVQASHLEPGPDEDPGEEEGEDTVEGEKELVAAEAVVE